MPASTRTTDVVHPHTDAGRRALRHRRATSWLTFGLLFVVIASAVADGIDVIDVWGVDDERVVSETASDGTTLSVRYPTVTRPALASPFEIEVERPGGFDRDIEIAVDLAYIELWDLNGIFPAPNAERSDGDRVVWTFDPPDGERLRIVYEARIEPGVQLDSREAAVTVLSGADQALTVTIETSVRP